MGSYNGNGFLSALIIRLIAALTIIIVVVIGIGLGLSLAETANIKNNENFIEFAPALPTRLLDINGTLITEYSADEKRELVSLSELPRHLIHAVLAREDPDFYNHRGFSLRAIMRAAVGQVTRNNMGGGSTISQQVAGTLYANRTERTIRRKVVELWWAFQMERRYTKNEILEIYLNYMPMGPGTYGVETASKYFFGHSAKDVSLAEAAVLSVLLSGPGRFNPISNPNQAMNRQRFVLERMIEFGYTDKEEADASFIDYWDNFDWTRASIAAYYTREDRAPWFSEYVRRELDVLMYGSMDYYRDGYIVHTTLNLHHQETAEKLVAETLETANRDYRNYSRRSNIQAERTFIPVIELLTLCFDLTDIRETTAGQNEIRAVTRYNRTINPVVDMAALAFGISELREITSRSFAQQRVDTERNVVEGAFISIENETGYITSIIGGSKYDENNQFIRATQGSMPPGSAFKSLYYSAAIDSRKFTAASLLHDAPIVFFSEDGTPYIPNNYGGIWRGPVLLYNALAISMNIPSLVILDTIGFDAAIDRSAALMGITDSAEIRRTFPRVYPLGLGVNSTSPLQMARAFAVFGNQGRSVTPIAIRTIEDRNGRVIFDIERELRQRQRRENIQIVSPQNAYIMTKIMERTIDLGTLRFGTGGGSKFTYRDENGRSYRLPVAAKTGTTQNWSDGWVVGYSPYYTSAMWFGFDKPGNSLGVDVAGATLAGPAWGDFMREIHQGLPPRDFIKPSSGIIDVTVCARSGLLRTSACNQGERTFPFLEGTQPMRYCDIHGSVSPFETRIPVSTIPLGGIDHSTFLDSLPMPQLQLDLLPELQELLQPSRNQIPGRNQSTNRNQNTGVNQNTNRNQNNNRTPADNNTAPPVSFFNPFLDDEPLQVIIPAVVPAPTEGESQVRSADPELSIENYTQTPQPAGDLQFTDTPDIVMYIREDEEKIYDEHTGTYYDELPSWNSLE